MEKVAFLRSAAKPVQVLPVLTSGAIERFGIQPPEVAIMAASHSGEERHVAVVKGILDKLGLEPSHLQCGTHVPFLGPSPYAIYQRGEEPTALHNACSGKHCGMLALALQQGWDLIDYVVWATHQQMLHALLRWRTWLGKKWRSHRRLRGAIGLLCAMPIVARLVPERRRARELRLADCHCHDCSSEMVGGRRAYVQMPCG